MPSECTCSKCAQICMCVWTSPLSVISPAAVASHAENWHGSPTWGGKFTWLLVWFYIITLTVTHFTGENWRGELARLLSSSRRAQARLVMQTSRQLIYKWSESMIQPWEEKKIEKRVAVQVNFTDMVLYIEQTGLQSGESERANSVWCQTPLLYLQATVVDTQGPTVTTISLTWHCSIYHSLPAHSRKHTFFQSPSPGLQHMEPF